MCLNCIWFSQGYFMQFSMNLLFNRNSQLTCVKVLWRMVSFDAFPDNEMMLHNNLLISTSAALNLIIYVIVSSYNVLKSSGNARCILGKNKFTYSHTLTIFQNRPWIGPWIIPKIGGVHGLLDCQTKSKFLDMYVMSHSSPHVLKLNFVHTTTINYILHTTDTKDFCTSIRL